MPSRPPKPALVRADQLLVDQGLAVTREQARALILAGAVRSGTARIEKPGQQLRENIALAVAQRPKYVSRGGDKLEGALNAFRPDARGPLKVRGITVLDIGSSTGGFTDCLLQRGAAKSYAVDVGTAQLAEKLRQDPRVVSLERTNVRHGIDLPEQVDLIVADVSFISLRLVLPPALEHLKPNGLALVLVKPQFEAGKDQVRNKGIIRDPAVHASVTGGLCLWAINQGLRVLGVRPSPIEGGDGNREFFLLLRKPPDDSSA